MDSEIEHQPSASSMETMEMEPLKEKYLTEERFVSNKISLYNTWFPTSYTMEYTPFQYIHYKIILQN